MPHEKSKSFGDRLNEKLEQLETVCHDRTGNSGADLEIGILISRLRDNEDSLGAFAFCLSDMCSDACVLKAEFGLFATEEGMLLVAVGIMWARCMISSLLRWDIRFDFDNSRLGNPGDVMGAREMQFGVSKYN